MIREPETGPEADVCLIVEGAYPYVVGGVSAWVQDLIRNLPDIRFAIVAIKPGAAPVEHRVPLPPNVVELVEVGLAPEPETPRAVPDRVAARLADALIRTIAIGGAGPLDDLIDLLGTLKPVPRPGDVLAHPIVFHRLQRYYRAVLPSASFHHYFWATRVLLGGLLSALTVRLPRARVYHTVSTGFAGLVAARARRQTGRPALITEHGIYLLERQIEVLMADWIGDQVDSGLELERSVRDLRDLWVRAFASYAGACYEACDPIVALYGENGVVQRRLGAPPDRLRIIPNGIDATRFAELPDRRDPAHPIVALLGRVVPIKDVKTFIRSAALVHARWPHVRFVVLGPTDEDPDYVAECRDVVDRAGIGHVFRFEGRVAIDDWLPRLDLLVLTSLSEAQPLAILEAGAAGIPFIAPNVGSCREMIEGRGPGEAHGGIVTPLVDPAATASAIETLLANPSRRRAMGAALRARVIRDYDHDTIISAYRNLYADFASRDQAMDHVQAPAAP